MTDNPLVPAGAVNRYTNQSTFVIERAFLFAEYSARPLSGVLKKREFYAYQS